MEAYQSWIIIIVVFVVFVILGILLFVWEVYYQIGGKIISAGGG
jgi:hypothetical protein